MCSIVNQSNLLNGIAKWHQKKKKWDTDFHNCFYCKLRILLLNGLNESNWETMVYHLSCWRANRGKSKDFIYRRWLRELSNLNQFREQIDQNSTIENVHWEEIKSIFLTALSIKNVVSPVFASKLSHFLFPKIFPVIDNEVIGLGYGPYNNYWGFIKKNWTESQEKEICKQILANAIGENAIKQYPWAIKITEICLIGFNAEQVN